MSRRGAVDPRHCRPNFYETTNRRAGGPGPRRDHHRADGGQHRHRDGAGGQPDGPGGGLRRSRAVQRREAEPDGGAGAEIANAPAGERMGDSIDRACEMADLRVNAVVPRQFVIPPNAGSYYEDDRTGSTRRAERRGGRGRDGLWNRGDADRDRLRIPRAGPGRPRRCRRARVVGVLDEGPRGGRIRHRTVPPVTERQSSPRLPGRSPSRLNISDRLY